MRSESFYGQVPLQLRLNEPCGRTLCGPGWERTRENSLNLRDWELWLVWRGSGWMRTAGGRHPLFAGFCALMRPGGIYDAGHDESDPLGITFIHFDVLRGQGAGGNGRRDRGASLATGADASAGAHSAVSGQPTGSVQPAASGRGQVTGTGKAGRGGRAATPAAGGGHSAWRMGQTPVETESRPLLIDEAEALWPEFFLLDDIEYADLLTSRLLALLYDNLPAATALLHAFLADLLEREPITAEAWVVHAQAADAAAKASETGTAGRQRAASKTAKQTTGALSALSQRGVPHYRELRQLFARLRTTSPEALPGVAQMATQMGLSPEHFSRLFRRVNGQSPMQLIVSLRITHARHLLRESSLSVGEIADRLGYADVYFFSRQFKEQAGVSPLVYRRQG